MTRIILALCLAIAPMAQVHPCCCDRAGADNGSCEARLCQNCSATTIADEGGEPLRGPCPCEESQPLLAAVLVDGSVEVGHAGWTTNDSAEARAIGSFGDPKRNATSRIARDASPRSVLLASHALLQRLLL